MKHTLYSMTGFASKTIQLPPRNTKETVSLTISLKSLNSRFFEATCRFAYALSSLEIELTSRARNELKRGSLTISLDLSDINYFKGQIHASLSSIEGYLNALKTAQKKFKLPGEISIVTLLQFPNIFSVKEETINDKIKQQILTEFDEVLTELKQARAREGIKLLNDLNKRIAQLKKLIKNIEQTFEETFKKRQEEVNTKLKKLQQETSELSQEQRMQVYLELDRIDIHEEITRFNTHLHAFNTIVASKQEEKGRQLDFILQELTREINTMSAKCASSTISAHAVAIKVELEKCREQVQNIV